jgi:hypothetical protein
VDVIEGDRESEGAGVEDTDAEGAGGERLADSVGDEEGVGEDEGAGGERLADGVGDEDGAGEAAAAGVGDADGGADAAGLAGWLGGAAEAAGPEEALLAEAG